MARRTLQASPVGIDLIRKSLKRTKLSQTVLAVQVDCSRQTIYSLLHGNAIDCDTFIKICDQLKLDLNNVAVPELLEDSPAIDALVQQARERVQLDIEHRCGWMKVLDMRHKIEWGAIYTDVNILEKITGKTRRNLDKLMQGCTAETFDRFSLGKVREERVDGLEAVRRQKQLMILGRPGAGKTTFLKRLATLCNRGEFLPEQVPIFITLKEFAETVNEPKLVDFIAGSMPDLSIPDVDRLLLNGRGFVLLDGLDEVNDRVLLEIRKFAQRYAQTSIVITCRIAAWEYIFEHFTEVEIADFSDEQIQDFADKWFKVKKPEQIDAVGQSTIGHLFWQALEKREPVKELATNPLLLTLLCLEFEESSEFPSSRAELYKRGLNILLSKWDEQRRIIRDEVYKRLTIYRKASLLGKLAMQTFERGDYFFRTDIAEELIRQYIENLPDASNDPEALLVDSHAVLKSIEAQHGLLIERATDFYSFSHLTFHEYFTAKNILDITDPAAQATALSQLVTHVSEKQWREVFLLVVERMDRAEVSADNLLTLMKCQIDRILAQDEKLQRTLSWVEEKSCLVETTYKPAAVRAFYFVLARHLGRHLERNLNRDLALDRALDPALNRALDYARALDPALNRDLNRDLALNLARDPACDLDHALDFACGLGLKQALQQVKHQLSDPSQENWKNFKQYWQANSQFWTEQLRDIMIEHRNVGRDWQFSEVQQTLLQQYYDANMLLINCLNSNCHVTPEVRNEIEATLLLPSHPSNAPH